MYFVLYILVLSSNIIVNLQDLNLKLQICSYYTNQQERLHKIAVFCLFTNKTILIKDCINMINESQHIVMKMLKKCTIIMIIVTEILEYKSARAEYQSVYSH